METIQIEVKSAEDSDRMELFIRLVYGLVAGIVIGIFQMCATFAWIIQFLHILFLGKRHPSLSKFINAVMVTTAEYNFYTWLATDERPPMIPKF